MFRGDFNLGFLDDWPRMQMELKVDEFSGTVAAINDLYIPEFFDVKLPVLPDFLERTGQFPFPDRLRETSLPLKPMEF